MQGPIYVASKKSAAKITKKTTVKAPVTTTLKSVDQYAADFLATTTGQAFLTAVGQTVLNVSALSLAQKNYFYSELRDYINNLPKAQQPTTPAPTQGAQAQFDMGHTISATTAAVNPELTFTLPSQVKFNLPPHSSSLPLRTNDTGMGTSASVPITHDTRRAIIWYYGGADTQTTNKLYTPAGAQDLTSTAKGVEYKTTSEDTNWGFQFLWNPESITTTMTRNSSVIPSNLDKFASLNGLFTAMEALQFTITIDRTNDFAFAKALYAVGGSGFEQFYKNGYPGDPSELFDTKFKNLMKRGTLADIEYIYRTINRSGQNGQKWLNGLGQETAELGFLSPTAIGVRFGPNPESLSYVGWVEQITVNHTKFTEDMIPIHSDVTLQFNAFSRVSLTSTSVATGK